MKRISVTLMLLVAVICAMAQEHLLFKGIPIEGSMTTFCQKLEDKGFVSVGSDNDVMMFRGDFTGREANVNVIATDKGKNVFSVVVFFEPSGEWNTLVNTYNYYKNLYTRKYGDPEHSEESNPAYSNTNTSLMLEVFQGTVVYESMWNVTGGDILLSIEKYTAAAYEHKGIVIITYRDSQNNEAKIKNDLDEI